METGFTQYRKQDIWKCIVIFMIKPMPEKELLVSVKQRVDWMQEHIWT
jgi:hypothetical protein